MSELLPRLGEALLERYRVEREIGRGGMGVVLLARDLRHDRDVAIKIMRGDMASAVYVERFLREIRVLARLQHPNIVPLLDSGETNGMAYFVMPYVPGESLRDRLDREKQLAIPDALQLALEIADALGYAHSQHIVHRDIKPENILISGGHALVNDFGIARLLQTTDGEHLTATGVSIGTPEYMSPEQASGDEIVDHRSDIYSLACVLYEMLSGSPPYTGSNAMAVMKRKVLDPLPGLRVVRDTLPPHVEDAIARALAKVPADRFDSAHEFAKAIRDPQFNALRSSIRRRRRGLVGVVVGAAVLVAGAYVLGARPPSGGAANVRFTQFTTAAGVEWFPSMSPDGKWVVYASEQSGNRDIYLQSVTGAEAFNLTADSPAADDQPAFSPDGERIAFRSNRDSGGIFVMNRTGGGVRRLTRQGYRPTWSPDGSHIAFSTENVELLPGNTESLAQLWIVDVVDGTQRQLRTAVDPIFPSWSPHGHRIAYSRRLGTPAQGDIYTISAEGTDTVAVTSDRFRDWSPAWSRDGRWLYFASDRGGSMNLWRVPIDEKTGHVSGDAAPVTTPATYLAHPSVSANGVLAYTAAQTSINIERLQFDPDAGVVIGNVEPVTNSTRQWSDPDPSPDGSVVAFYTLTQPEGDLYIARSTGGELRQLTSDTAIDRMPRWSPDGRRLAYFSSRAGPLNVWTINADGSENRRVASMRSAYSAWSPDGSRLAVGAGEGYHRVLIIDPARPAGENIVDSLPQTSAFRFLVNDWSGDGLRLLGQAGAVGEAAQGIVLYDFTTRRYTKLLSWGQWPVWLPDDRRILFVANRHEFWLLDSRTGALRKVYENTRDIKGPPRLTWDGRVIFFSRRSTDADIWLVSLR